MLLGLERSPDYVSGGTALGSKFGYFTNVSKTWLVTKENYLSTALDSFADTDVKVTSEGRP